MFLFKNKDLPTIDIDLDVVLNYIITYGLRILYALLVLFIGLKLIKLLVNRLNRRFDRLHVDTSLKSFVSPLVSVLLKIMLILSIIGMFGIEATSFIAILGSLGLAVGLAFQGSLANFAGGVLILILKPYKIGDYIETDKYSGTVKDIHIFYTILATPDNRKVVIPNANLSNASLVNTSTYDKRRFELKISCSYDNDVMKVKSVLENFITKHPKVLTDPSSFVSILEYGAVSINFGVYGWVKSSDYGSVYREVMFELKGVLDKEGIIIRK